MGDSSSAASGRAERSVSAKANVARFLEAMAAERPDGDALFVPRGRTASGEIEYLRLSFKELAAEQDSWAAVLRAAGIGRGSRTLLMVRPGLPLIAICFALFKIGAVPVVIDPGMGLKSFLSCVRRSKPEFLVGIPLAVWVSRVFRGSFKTLRGKVKVASGMAVRIPGGAAASACADTASDELAAILFTSGSTGAPKGVLYEHGMFEAQVSAIRRQYGIEPGEVDLPMLPIFALFNPALGMATVVPEIDPSKPASVDPAKIVQAIRQRGVTSSFGSPALWTKIARYCAAESIKLPTMRRILIAGAPAGPRLLRLLGEALPNGEIHSPYGATEILPVSSVSAREALAEAEASSSGGGTCVGHLLPDTLARILTAGDGPLEAADLERGLPVGEIGEIVVSGPSVTNGYDGLPEATRLAKIVAADGRVWHRMGDLGYFDAAGRLWFCGRKAERVESRGEWFYTDCCEGVFNPHPKVFRSALIGIPDTDGGRVPALVVEPFAEFFPKTAAEREAFIAELKALGGAAGATRKIDRFFFEKALPVDVRHNAKIHRLTLAKRYAK